MFLTTMMREMELEAFATLVFSTGAMSASLTFNLPLIAFHWKVAPASLGMCSSVPLIFFLLNRRQRERGNTCSMGFFLTPRLTALSIPQRCHRQILFSLFCSLSLSHSFTRHVNIVTSIAFSNSQDWRHLFIEECPMPEIKKNRYLRNSVLPNFIGFDYRTPRIAKKINKIKLKN